MCAPIGGRIGPVGAHPRTRRGTARTLAGSVREYAIHYTGMVDVAYFAPNQRSSVYLVSRNAFLSPAARSASSPHQSPLGRSDERFRVSSLEVLCHGRHARIARIVPVLSIVIDRHNCEEGGRRQLLALHDMR